MPTPVSYSSSFHPWESCLSTMKQYKYYFFFGLFLHLMIVFLIITQPMTDQYVDSSHTLELTDDDLPLMKYSVHEDIIVTKIAEREVLSKRSIDNLVNAKLLSDIENSMEHLKHLPSRFRQIEGIYVFGSFLDHRPDGYPMIRILALQKLKDPDSLVCLFEENDKYYLTYTEKYEMCENHGKVYGGFIYSCSIPQHMNGIPSEVILSIMDEDQERNTNYHIFNLAPLHNHRNNSWNAIGVCLPPLYGDISSSKIIQFIELAKILNASNFFVYKNNVSKNTDILLNYYANIGDVVLKDWSLPGVIHDHDIWNKGQLLAIQDCLFTHMNRFKYLIFLDWDEILVPRTRFSWTQMLQKIESEFKFKKAAISFQSAFFDPNLPSNLDQSIQFLQLQERTVDTSDVRSKVVVRPERVFELGIHHLSKPLDKKFKSINIDPEIALIHHYRSCESHIDQSMECFPTMRDDIMLTYAKRLTNRVKNTQHIMSIIYHHFQNDTSLTAVQNVTPNPLDPV